MTENQKKLFDLAVQARQRAYVPYSHAQVGAAVLMQNQRLYSGCNIENASYGGTVCAERVAIFKAISDGAAAPLMEVLVVTDSDMPWPPCGFCRQVIAEFATKDTLIHTANLQGKLKSFRFSEIFPEAFTPSYLQK